MVKVYNVLSIDGCGFRGRTQLLVLERLMRKLGGTAGPRRPCEVFDLICGTATGGLIAILVGRLGMDCSQAIDAYDRLERAVFSRHQTPNGIYDLLTQHQPFDVEAFRQALNQIVESNVDMSVPDPKRFKMSTNDKHTRLCKTFVTVVPRQAAADNDASCIRSYKDPHVPSQPPIFASDPQYTWRIQDAAIATTLCPRLFSPKEITTPSSTIHTMQAANMSGFSNPSMIADDEAHALFGNEAEITFISLGMGLRNRHEYGATDNDINNMVGQLGLSQGNNVDNQRLMEFIRQTHIVATSTQIKHLRLSNLMGRRPGQLYFRFDPPRNGRPYILVDYVQTALADEVANDSFGNVTIPWDQAVLSLQRTSTARWVELPGFKSGANQLEERNRQVSEDPAQIMQECYRWEETANAGLEESTKQYISCFTIGTQHVRLMTGPILPEPDSEDGSDGGRLFVRVLLDDQWRFFSQLKVLGRRQWESQMEFANSGDPFEEPLIAARAAQADMGIRGINSEGFHIGSAVRVEDVKVPDSGYNLPYHGTWIRITT